MGMYVYPDLNTKAFHVTVKSPTPYNLQPQVSRKGMGTV